MRAVVIGDSITYGVFTGPNDDCPKSRPEKTWFDSFCDAMNITEHNNYSVSGISVSRMTNVNPNGAISNKYRDMHDFADYVFISGGTNDYGTNVPVGTSNDTEDVSFYGALDLLCRGLKEKYKEASVIFIVPIKRRWEDKKNEVGAILDDYRNAIKKVAGERYGFYIIDGKDFGFDPDSEEGRKRHMLDGLHPNEEGHFLYAQKVIENFKDMQFN